MCHVHLEHVKLTFNRFPYEQILNSIPRATVPQPAVLIRASCKLHSNTLSVLYHNHGPNLGLVATCSDPVSLMSDVEYRYRPWSGHLVPALSPSELSWELSPSCVLHRSVYSRVLKGSALSVKMHISSNRLTCRRAEPDSWSLSMPPYILPSRIQRVLLGSLALSVSLAANRHVPPRRYRCSAWGSPRNPEREKGGQVGQS